MSYFTPMKGDWVVEKIPTKASTTYTAGQMLYDDGTDAVPTVAATQQNVLGIALESKASASNTNPIHILVPKRAKGCTFIADVTTGTIAATNVNKNYDFDAAGTGVTTSTTYLPIKLKKFITTTKGEYEFNFATGINAS